MACLWLMLGGVVIFNIAELFPIWATALYLAIMIMVAVYVICISYKLLQAQRSWWEEEI